MAAKKEESQINDIINTTKSIRQSGKPDTQLQSEQLKRARGIANCPMKKFKCASVYATIYPDGYTTTYQGIVINLIFDNRIVELPEPIYYFVTHKLERKADIEADKLNRFKTKKQKKLGEYQAE